VAITESAKALSKPTKVPDNAIAKTTLMPYIQQVAYFTASQMMF
jgi:hypothetical protein